MGLLAIALVGAAGAAEITYRGFVAGDARAFAAPPREVVQNPLPGGSLVAQPRFELDHEARNRTVVVLEPFARFDSQDGARSHADVRQGDLVWRVGHLELAGGVGQFRWGSLQGASPVDVVNQRDQVEDLTGRARLGQPYAGGGVTVGALTVGAWYLPVQRGRTFPGLAGRLRPSSGVDAAEPQYPTDWGWLSPAAASRATLSAGPMDLSVSGFSGPSRDPRFVAQFTSAQVAVAYDPLQQLGVDTAIVAGPLVLKGEGAARWWTDDRLFSWVAAGGVEYTRLSFANTRADLSLVLEYTHDLRPVGAPVTPYDHDAFGGLRLGLNDRGGSELVAGAQIDVVTGFLYSRVALGRRLDDHWRVEAQANVFVGSDEAPEWWLAADDYAQIQLAYFL